MKTLDQVLNEWESKTLDGRDLNRLAQFLPESDLHLIGVELKEEYKGKHEPVDFTKENVLKQLEEDVRFGLEKAHNMRGISAEMMFEVVRMWNWVLEEGLEDFDQYGSYGIPLFMATAKKYGFEV